MQPRTEKKLGNRSATRGVAGRAGSGWHSRLRALQAFKQKFGHCDVPQRYPSNPGLGYWVTNVRYQWKLGKLAPELACRLQKLGFRWTIVRRAVRRWDWQFMLRELKKFKKKRGHCRVLRTENPALATWIFNVRVQRRKGTLTAEQSQQLDALGFEWEPEQQHWEEMFAAIVRYKARHGDCNMPAEWPKNPSLGRWAARQRQLRRRGMLEPSRVARLDALGFDWGRTYSSWEATCMALAEYRRKYGHCRVSVRDKDYSALGRWAREQRIARRQGRLAREKIQQLDKLGFNWDLRQDFWEQMFSALIQYKRSHGHCHVPMPCRENSRLASWVARQRALNRKGSLQQDRKKRLTALGFRWS